VKAESINMRIPGNLKKAVDKKVPGGESGLYISDIFSKTCTSYCVICSVNITYKGPHKKLKFTFTYKENKIICYRCIPCNNKKLLISPVTFMSFKTTILVLFTTLRRVGIIIPKDIRKMIAEYLFEIWSFDSIDQTESEYMDLEN